MDIAGKVAIVTGAGSGMGLATCVAMAAAGARIAGFEVNDENLERLRANLKTDILLRRVDVADEPEVQSAIDAVLDRWGAVHIAVNCAGVASGAKTVSKGRPFPLAEWNRVIAVNLTGTFNVTRLAALAMTRNAPDAKSGERGIIINVASGAATQGQVGQAAYSASKAGVMGLTLPVARDLAEYAIRVVSISPGLFDTGMAAGLPKVARTILDRMVLYPHRMGRSDEFASLVQHIVENEYFNATTIDLDAGVRLTAQ
jgi:NAD(P)-dependent dehydrogenase (short-subunit alcohol dehydrogenase family)